MKVNMRVKLLTITLLSQLTIGSPSTQVFAAEASSKATPALTQDDKIFLREKIGEDKFKFPTNAKDKVINRAAKFLNDMRLTDDMTYQELMDKLIDEDKRLSQPSSRRGKAKNPPLLPGAFLDAASALFAQDAAAAAEAAGATPKIVRREERRTDEDDFKTFSNILEIQAKIFGLVRIPVEQCIANLRTQLDVASKRGKHYKKVYVYSDGPEYEAEYAKLMLDYPDIKIVYRVFPSDINVFFTGVRDINDGFVFIDRLPVYYEPMYAPVWYPFYSHVFVDDYYFLGFGYPSDVWGYWNGYYGAFSLGIFANWGYNRFGGDWHHNYREYRYRDEARGATRYKDTARGATRYKDGARSTTAGSGRRQGEIRGPKAKAGAFGDRSAGIYREGRVAGGQSGHGGGRHGGGHGDGGGHGGGRGGGHGR